jgi:hypothetical protein
LSFVDLSGGAVPGPFEPSWFKMDGTKLQKNER